MSYQAVFPATMSGISACLEFIEQSLKEYRLKKRDLLESLLISEESLVRLQSHAAEDAEISVKISRWLNVPRIHFLVPGTPVSLDEQIEDSSVDIMDVDSDNVIRSIMLRSYANSIKYRYTSMGNSMTIITGIPERVLALQTLLAFGLAVLFGIILRAVLPEEITSYLVLHVFSPVQTLFISGLTCIAAPAVFVSVVCSMLRFEGISDLAGVSKRVVLNFVFTSLVAIAVGMVVFHVLEPGSAGMLSVQPEEGNLSEFSFLSVLLSIIPPNIIEPFIDGNSLQLIVTAAFVGMALSMSGSQVKGLKSFFQEVDILCSKIVFMFMSLVPIVVFCSATHVVVRSSRFVLLGFVELVLVLLAGIAGMILFYCAVLLIRARLSPIILMKKTWPALRSTFLKGSSMSAIPITMRTCKYQLGIPKKLCSFSIPLGAAINMDGNCVCLTIISLFFARACGVPMGIEETLVTLLLVFLLSLGAPIAPGTLIVCMVTLLAQMGISADNIALVIGINFILEMFLGALNSLGTIVMTLAAAKREGILNEVQYNK